MQRSADATRNTSMGGHVTQHIYGMTPPSGSSQKTRPCSSREQLRRGLAPVRIHRQSGGLQRQQQVPGGFPGEAAHGQDRCLLPASRPMAEGVCTRWDTYMAKEISYGFVLKDGKWILNTLYPVPLD
ncbi:hypothetical protein P4123_17005 [Pseudomonas aeruginosa]|nr:hypothetical protein [Pseudomonas aeruginosa]